MSEQSTMMKDHITIKGRDGAFGAYIARPKTLPAPAVVVLQELFGVNADIRKTCDELAEQGFIAVAPDLFWRQEPGVDLRLSPPRPTGNTAFVSIRPMTETLAPGTSRTPSTPCAKLPGCTGKVAVLGYCLGALMVFLTAVR